MNPNYTPWTDCCAVTAAAGNRMRIAIIPAIFDPDLNYIENVFASTLHDMGHDVRVFTSYHGIPKNSGVIDVRDSEMPFRIIRSKRVLKVAVTQIPWDKGMGDQINGFNPEVAFVVAPNHGLGAAWLKHLPATCRIIAGFSDLPWHRGRFRTWIKRHLARHVIHRAETVITVTRETQQLVIHWAGPQHAGKVKFVGLPFRPEDLVGGFAPAKALELSLRVRHLIVCVTRVNATKQLGVLFQSMERHLIEHPDSGFVMAGFDQGSESCRLRDIIAASPVAARCVILPLLDISEIGGLFRIASCSIWSMVSIGIYHSLHCGCPVLVKTGQDAAHLLDNPAAGRWFADLTEVNRVLPSVLLQSWDRTDTSAVVEQYCAKEMLIPLLAGGKHLQD